MTSMKSKPAGFFAHMHHADAALRRADTNNAYGRCDEDTAAHAGPVLPAADRRSGGYRICLDCALPLQRYEHGQGGECSCRRDDAIEDDWMEFGGMEIIFILGLLAAGITASFWFWL